MAAGLPQPTSTAATRLRLTVPQTVPLAPSSPRVSVVIVNFCQWRNTFRLVRQLRSSECSQLGSAEIIVVDNHSPRDPVIRKLRRTEGVSLRRFSRNRGFAKAVNEGCRLGRGDWMLLLNPDMSVPRGFLDHVHQIARQLEENHPQIGVVGFRLKHPDGSKQASCGPYPTFLNTLAGLFLPRAERKCRVLPVTEPTEVPWVTGCCLLTRRECLKDLRGFDEDFFLYYEDVDLCRRAKDAGWSVWFDPSLELTHHTPLHIRSVPAPLRLMTRHALLTYSKKYWSGWQKYLLGGMIWSEAMYRQIRSYLAGNVEETRFHAEMRKIVGDVLRNNQDRARERIRLAAAYLETSSSLQDGKAC